MPVAIRITLPFGRYSATPWGQHVNEGSVEWPPSPWRLARAMVASWHAHHPSLKEEEVAEALSLLCEPPAYRLPKSSRGVTRHYMPSSKHQSHDRGKNTALVLNSFVTTNRGDAVTLFINSGAKPSQVEVLRRLASTLSYVGRAESRAIVEVEEVDTWPPPECLTSALDGDSISDEETVRLLVPDAPLDLEAVCVTSAALQKRGRTQPPATSWHTYPAPRDRPTGLSTAPEPSRTTVVQFAITGNARPEMINAALLAATARRVFTSQAPDRASLHGHDLEGKKREDDHLHAHYLVLSPGNSGRADTLVVYAAEGFSADAVAAMGRVTHFNVPDHLKKRLGTRIRVAMESAGDVCLIDSTLTGSGKVWTSLTPFTTRRHQKKRETRREFFEDAIRRHLRHRGLPHTPSEVTVEVLDRPEGSARPARSWYRSRRLGIQNQHQGCFARLEFNEAVEPDSGGGPELMVLGSLAHFGLGVFAK